MTKKNKNKSKHSLPSFRPNMVNQAPGGAQTGVRVGFPVQRRVTLPYVGRFAISVTVGAINFQQFRLNSAFDPDYTGTGHQPMGYDQWAGFYNHYVVEHVKWQVEMLPYTGTFPETLECGVHLSDDSTIPSDPQTLAELGAQVLLRPKTATGPAIFSGKMSLKQFFNRTGDIANDSSLRALVSANPIELAFLSVFAACPNSESCTVLVYFKAEMTIKFVEPTDLAPSRVSLPPPADGQYRDHPSPATQELMEKNGWVYVGPQGSPTAWVRKDDPKQTTPGSFVQGPGKKPA